MVPNPRRYCECIGADVLNDMFCEAPIDPSECVCTAIYDPVTCEDGKEYSNDCFAGCSGQTQCSAKVDERVFDRSDFTSVIDSYQNVFNRPTGLGVNDLKGNYISIAAEYSRPAGLGKDDAKSPSPDTEDTDTDEEEDTTPATSDTDTTR